MEHDRKKSIRPMAERHDTKLKKKSSSEKKTTTNAPVIRGRGLAELLTFQFSKPR